MKRVAATDSDGAVALLESSVIPVRLSFLTPEGSPAVASHWFLFEDSALWLAVQDDSFVARCLRKDSRCAFEVAGDQPPYRGVRGRGTATLHPELGESVLTRLMDRYLGDRNRGLREYLSSRAAREVAVRVEAETSSHWDYSHRMES